MPTAQAVIWDETTGESPATMTIPVNAAISGANASALLAAAAALSLGTVGRTTLVIDTLLDPGSDVRPTDENAQKEIRYRVGFTDDDNGKKYSFTIPCADLSLKDAGTEDVPLDGTEAAAFVTAFEANGRTELGNTLTVNSIKFVTL